jgi:ribosomal protein L4
MPVRTGKKSEHDLTRSSVSSRAPILHRMVRYQLAKRQAGTHKASSVRRSGTGEEVRPPERWRRRPSRFAAPQFRGWR